MQLTGLGHLKGWKAIADALGVSKPTAQKLERTGAITVHRLGRAPVVFPEDLESYIGQAAKRGAVGEGALVFVPVNPADPSSPGHMFRVTRVIAWNVSEAEAQRLVAEAC
jgi:hypothetical protein